MIFAELRQGRVRDLFGLSFELRWCGFDQVEIGRNTVTGEDVGSVLAVGGQDRGMGARSFCDALRFAARERHAKELPLFHLTLVRNYKKSVGSGRDAS
jgi:hypothetical protein